MSQEQDQPQLPVRPLPSTVRHDCRKVEDWHGSEMAEVRTTSGRRRILGIDPGTQLGYAVVDVTVRADQSATRPDLGGSLVYAGVWNLAAGDYDSGAIRFLRLRRLLSEVRPDVIFYEEPRATPPAMGDASVAAILARSMTSAEFLAAIKATICCWAEEFGVPCAGVPIGTIKKRATGKGNASKEMMIVAANTEFGVKLDPEHPGDDNVADALWVLKHGLDDCWGGLETGHKNDNP